MKREYVCLHQSKSWHLPSRDGKATLCNSMFRLTNVQQVLKSETFPEPACRHCKDPKLINGYPHRIDTSVDHV